MIDASGGSQITFLSSWSDKHIHERANTMAEIAVFDVETTGLSPAIGHRVIEIGFVILGEDLIVKRYFESLINPERPISNVRNHGIRECDVRNAPTFKDVLPRLVGELKEVSCLVGHNLIQMDFPFFESELKRCGYLLPDLKKVCTLDLARRIKPGAENNKLLSLAEHFGIGFPAEQHRALSDALVTAELLKCFSHFFEVSIPPIPQWPRVDGPHHDFVIRNGSKLNLNSLPARALGQMVTQETSRPEARPKASWRPSAEQCDRILNRLFEMAFDADSRIATKAMSTLSDKAKRNPKRFGSYVSTLSILSQKGNSEVRFYAICALGHLPFKSSTKALRTTILQLSDEYLRSASNEDMEEYCELIFYHVGSVGTKPRAEILCRIVCDQKRDPLIRAYAASAIGICFEDCDDLSFITDDLVNAASELTEHPNSKVRHIAMELLLIL